MGEGGGTGGLSPYGGIVYRRWWKHCFQQVFHLEYLFFFWLLLVLKIVLFQIKSRPRIAYKNDAYKKSI